MSAVGRRERVRSVRLPRARRLLAGPARRGLGVTVIVSVVVCGAVMTAWERDALTTVEHASVDARFSLRPAPPQPTNLLLVTVDRQFASTHAAAQVRPRAAHARAVRALDRAGAKLIVFGFDFAPPSFTRDDLALEAAMRRAGNVAYGFSDVAADRGHAGDFVLFGQWGSRQARRLGLAVGSLITREPIRQLEYTVRYETQPPRTWPSLAVAAAQAATGKAVPRELFPDNRAWIDYAGPPGTLPRVPFADLLGGRVAPARLRDKIVVIGADNPVQGRHVTSASSSRMSGVEVIGNQLNTVLRGMPLREAPAPLAALSIFLLALLPALVARCLRPIRAGILMATALLGYLALAQVAFNTGTILPVVGPVLAFVCSVAFVAAINYAHLARDRQRLRRRFAQMDAAAIDAVLHPERATGRARISSTSIVAGYRIEEAIGQGGMGAVYRATQLALGREVALKVICDSHAEDPHYRERFVRESQMASAVDHPNVIPIYEAGEDNGVLFIAMRLVAGSDLESQLRHAGPMSPADALAIVDQLAAAVHAAHAVGLVHRDVKPANVLLTDDVPPHVYLTDFGIARHLRPDDGMTLDATPVGTLSFMAPEQINGLLPSPATDVYALAGVLVAALTGAPPYPRGSDVATLYAHLHDEPPRVGVTPELDLVIAHALAKQPEKRYASAQAFSRAARWALEGIFVGPRATGPVYAEHPETTDDLPQPAVPLTGPTIVE